MVSGGRDPRDEGDEDDEDGRVEGVGSHAQCNCVAQADEEGLAWSMDEGAVHALSCVPTQPTPQPSTGPTAVDDDDGPGGGGGGGAGLDNASPVIGATGAPGAVAAETPSAAGLLAQQLEEDAEMEAELAKMEAELAAEEAAAAVAGASADV
eukprot:COSAG01_NODE_3160_length_6484_cov_3.337510_2_plen_152_part_00